jgi:hypothetical protein
VVDDSTRFEKRWGGWYVTGYTGKEPHRGNATGSGEGKAAAVPPSDKRPAELSEFFDTSRYPVATSDMVNLLILEHQISVYNSLTRVGQDARLGREAWDYEIVDRLLFRRGARLPEGIVRNTAFASTFLADARRSRAGDSLKDLQLDGRLFRNRCSYLIYSETFAALPAALKARVFTTLFEALHNDDPAGRYGYLESDEKRRIYAILLETHAEARLHFERLAAKPAR